MREKLIGVLSENFAEFCNVDIIAGNCKISAITIDADKFADHLIANGVTIPVRCKDCVNYCGFEHCKNGICDVDSVSKRAVYPDDFCSYGERRTDAEAN